MADISDGLGVKKSVMTIDDVINDNTKIHHGTGTYGLEKVVLDEISRRIKPGMSTLETGSGMSTFLFILAGVNHTSITPDDAEFARIQKYCSTNGISTDLLTCICESSHTALPKQKIESFDLILIDGCHGIPMVHVDYLFSALALKTGGTLVLDDVRLSSVNDLLLFLKKEPSWRFDGVFGKTAFLTKLKSGEEIREWDNQPYVLVKTHKMFANWPIQYHIRRMGRAANMLFSGDFKTIREKLTR